MVLPSALKPTVLGEVHRNCISPLGAQVPGLDAFFIFGYQSRLRRAQ